MSAPKYEDLALVCRELSRLAGGGVPLPQALESVARDLRRGKLRKALDEVKEEVEQGTPLSQSFEYRKDQFPAPLSDLVAAGLESGDLPGALRIVAEQCEAEARIRREVRGLLAYPVLVVSICAAIAIVGGCAAAALAGEAPGWTGGSDGEGLGIVWGFGAGWASSAWSLPAALRAGVLALAKAADFVYALGSRSPLVTAGVVAGLGLLAWLALRAARRSPRARALGDRLVGLVPAIGRAVRTGQSARFLATFAHLLASGIPLERALPLLGRLFPHPLFRRTVLTLSRHTAEGGKAGEALLPSPVIPATVAWMVGTGEARGELPEALREAALYQEQRYRRMVSGLRVVWGPILQVGTGLVVFVLLLFLFTPLAGIYLRALTLVS
ncbi:MAG: type II secretion system F family protein [Planctomycetales bacterium]|nr:type II secretion system F family protein [Planctomycetales bacterium]